MQTSRGVSTAEVWGAPFNWTYNPQHQLNIKDVYAIIAAQ